MEKSCTATIWMSRYQSRSGHERSRRRVGSMAGRVSVVIGSSQTHADVLLDDRDDLAEVEARRVEDAGVVGRPHRGDRAGGVALVALAKILEHRLQVDRLAASHV